MNASVKRIGRVLHNAASSPGRRLFGLRFSLDYLRLIARLALRRGDRGGTVRLIGYEIEHTITSHTVFLVHEVFVNAAYDFKSDSAAPLIVDAGANIGFATLFFKRRYPEARVVAIEPDRQTFRTLTNNVSVNGLKNVTLINAALNESGEPITFYTSDIAGGIASSIYSTWGGSTQETVPGARLSDLIDGPVDLLKMDIEGAEYAVMRDLDASGKWPLIRRLILEYHSIEGIHSGGEVVRRELMRQQFTVLSDVPAGAPGTGIICAIRRDENAVRSVS